MDGITFTQVERKCAYNRKIRDAGSEDGLLIDWQVHLNGEHIATFYRNGKSSTYDLCDCEGCPMGYQTDRVLATSEKDFPLLVELNYHRLPTKQELAKRARDRMARNQAEARRLAWERRREKLVDQSEAMFRVIKDFRTVIGDRAETIIGHVEKRKSSHDKVRSA